ncbi:uncharacterized protein BDZ99DRAFT_531589, partial [Mytilinidion resinicola]
MAEAAMVIQLIQFSGMVLTCCYEYIEKAKKAPKEIRNAIDDTNSIKNLLERLQCISNNRNPDRFVILKSLNAENGPFQAYSSALAELDEKLKMLTDASTMRRHLQWALEAKGIEKILERLEKLKSVFYTALAGDAATQTVLIHDTMEEVRKTVQEMKAAEEKARILMWLDGPDPLSNHDSAKSKRDLGTCEWLVDSENFTSWFNTSATSQLLWLHAFPGAGKTILCSAVIEHLRSKQLSVDCAVIYYYFDFRNASRQTYTSFLRSLICQICARTKAVPKPVVKLYDACNGAAPGSEQLFGLLKDLLKKELRAFLIIDALDECPESEGHERKQVLAALVEIKALKASNLSVFVASRPEVDIKQAMEEICDIDIDIHASLTNEDIRLHIQAQMMKYPRLKRLEQSIKNEIEEKLMKDAGGSFLWVACQLEEVRQCSKPARILDQLNNPPKDLDTTYSRILSNVPEMYHCELRTILMLLSFSTRPMTIQEVAEATAVDLKKQSFTTKNRFGDPSDLLEFCSSLVSLDHKIIQFAHFSVKEYLLASRTKESIPTPFLFNDHLSHSQITQMCLIYLLDFNGGKKIVRNHDSEFPFLGYAALHWATHLTQVKETERDAIEALLMRVFDPENDNHLINLLNLCNPDGAKQVTMQPNSRTTRDFKPALYYASYYGLSPIVKLLLKHGADINCSSNDFYGTPLKGAIQSKQPEVLEFVLRKGANIHDRGGRGKFPVDLAIFSGNVNAAERLIELGAKFGESALEEALNSSRKEYLAKILLDRGADPNAEHKEYGSILQFATMWSSPKCVEWLLEAGADPKGVPDGEYGTP